MSKDKLIVQVAIKLRAPKGARVSRRVLQQIVEMYASGEELPAGVEAVSIFWRNPNRNGKLSDWRYHNGADLSNAPSPLESSPRGSQEDALYTLRGALRSGIVTF